MHTIKGPAPVAHFLDLCPTLAAMELGISMSPSTMRGRPEKKASHTACVHIMAAGQASVDVKQARM
jgi:hypothetical protein